MEFVFAGRFQRLGEFIEKFVLRFVTRHQGLSSLHLTCLLFRKLFRRTSVVGVAVVANAVVARYSLLWSKVLENSANSAESARARSASSAFL